MVTAATRRQADADDPFFVVDPIDGAMIRDATYASEIDAVDDDFLVAMFEDMVVVRRIDIEATALQRQGQLGLWPPALGQEAAQIGSARALRPSDFVFGSYREHAVAYLRGVDPAQLLRIWRGSTLSGWNPYEINMTTPAIVVGSQLLHAIGYAMGISRDRADDVALTYFGDGATSEGDFSEALGFACTFNAPVIFFCQNNQWAISAPVGVQTTVPIVQRAQGFGMRGIRVDGNDVLAVLAVTRFAAARARAGEGPTLIEAVTYRMGPHTTSDDPGRYRDPEQVAYWRERDPIDRLALALQARHIDLDAARARADRTADDYAARLRAGLLGTVEPHPSTMFDHVYAEPHRLLDQERREFTEYLDDSR